MRPPTATTLGGKDLAVVEPKPLATSWTVIANVVAFLGAAVPIMLTYLTDVLEPADLAKVTATVVMVMALLNLALRYFRTAAPIAGSPQDPTP